ncbi:hypothetical protein ACM42_35410 [Bradyrhizobium sp. CCBAU 25338]|nr:hypothetical protein [Bradyrhizobium sp. CCBAU 25338]
MLFKHDLYGKPLRTFPDHALDAIKLRCHSGTTRQRRTRNPDVVARHSQVRIGAPEFALRAPRNEDEQLSAHRSAYWRSQAA